MHINDVISRFKGVVFECIKYKSITVTVRREVTRNLQSPIITGASDDGKGNSISSRRLPVLLVFRG